jgi:hypothetical protein
VSTTTSQISDKEDIKNIESKTGWVNEAGIICAVWLEKADIEEPRWKARIFLLFLISSKPKNCSRLVS